MGNFLLFRVAQVIAEDICDNCSRFSYYVNYFSKLLKFEMATLRSNYLCYPDPVNWKIVLNAHCFWHEYEVD